MIEVARDCVLGFTGDIVEIGAGHGNTTIQLLHLAKDFDRKVHVIDPFEQGWDKMPDSYGKPYPEDMFWKTIEGYEHYLVLHKKSSQDLPCDFFDNTPLCFAFVDGLQFTESVYHDLKLIGKAPMICVDDINRDTGISQVKNGVDKFLQTNINKQLKIVDRWGYIFNKS